MGFGGEDGARVSIERYYYPALLVSIAWRVGRNNFVDEMEKVAITTSLCENRKHAERELLWNGYTRFKKEALCHLN